MQENISSFTFGNHGKNPHISSKIINKANAVSMIVHGRIKGKDPIHQRKLIEMDERKYLLKVCN